MYALVNNVESYPEFLNWCSGARVLSKGESQVTAELDIRFAGLSQSFATVNTLNPPNEIAVRLHSGPFKSLTGKWRFMQTPGGSKVSLVLDYTFGFSPLSIVLNSAFEEIARSQIDAFIQRARSVYGAQ